MTGTDKSTNGALRLSLVLKKSSFANTQDTTKTQPKLKSINSMLFSENKLRSGLDFKKTNCTVKSKLSTKESRAALLNGNCAPNKLRSGLVFKKTNCTVKSKLSTKESRAA